MRPDRVAATGFFVIAIALLVTAGLLTFLGAGPGPSPACWQLPSSSSGVFYLPGGNEIDR